MPCAHHFGHPTDRKRHERPNPHDGGSESSDEGAREASSGEGAHGDGGEGGSVDDCGGGEGLLATVKKEVLAAVEDMLTRVETVLADVEVDAVLEDVMWMWCWKTWRWTRPKRRNKR